MSQQVDRREVIALVPMRHHSERVPGKNYRQLAGKPLFHHILETLQAVPEIQRIVVDTDSPIIRQGVSQTFPEVRILDRPEHLRGDTVPMNDVLRYDLEREQAPFYLQTHATNPLLRPETIRQAIARFFDVYPEYDSLFSVTRLQTRLWDMQGHPLNHDPQVLIRTQDLPPLYEENSCLYIFEREGFLARGNRLGERPLLFEMAAEEAIDIDEETDFNLAQCLMQLRGGEGA